MKKRNAYSAAFLLMLLVAMGFLLPKITRAEEQSAFHFMSIVEVFPGSALDPNAQYIVLQMYFAGQQFVTGQQVIVYDAAGAPVGTFTFGGDVPNGANQAHILIATTQAATLFSLTADLTMTAAIPLAGGKICFGAEPFPIDCIAWGNYTGSTVNTGPPFNSCGGGLKLGRAIRRKLNNCGGAGTLEFCDDTNNSAADFFFTAPALRNNAGTAGTIPPSTCGNGTQEGLEGCDDNNTTPGDGCDPACNVETACAQIKGDFNGDANYTSSDVVLCLNCTFLGSGCCDPCFADVNCDAALTSSDVVLELNKAFLGQNAPPWCGP